nr:hypothetical protein [Tanacetum cinerariifolium]
MSLFQEAFDACDALTRRVKNLESDKVAQAMEITKLKRRVKKLEKGNIVRVLKLRRLKRVGTSQRIDISDDTVMDDESNQWRIIDKMDKDDVVALMDDKEEDKKDKEAKEVVDNVTTAKLITKVVTATSKIVVAASIIISAAEPQVPAATITSVPIKDKGKGILVEEPKTLKKKQQVEMDEEYARKLHAELNKDIDWDVAIDHVKLKAKEDLAAKFNSNVDFLLKTKEQIKEEESRALQRINETPAERAAREESWMKKWKISKDIWILYLMKMMMYTLKPLHLQEREDLQALWNLVKERFSTSKPKNFSDDFLMTTLGAMFEKPDAQDQV